MSIFGEAYEAARRNEVAAYKALCDAIASYPSEHECRHARVVWYHNGDGVSFRCLDCGRHERVGIGKMAASFITKAHEATGAEIKELRMIDVEMLNVRSGRGPWNTNEKGT